jgi:hypothetical protein
MLRGEVQDAGAVREGSLHLEGDTLAVEVETVLRDGGTQHVAKEAQSGALVGGADARARVQIEAPHSTCVGGRIFCGWRGRYFHCEQRELQRAIVDGFARAFQVLSTLPSKTALDSGLVGEALHNMPPPSARARVSEATGACAPRA